MSFTSSCNSQWLRRVSAPLLRRIGVLLVLCFAGSVGLASAQSTLGILPFSTQQNGVDIATGNVTIAFPLRSKAGKIPFWSQVIGTSGISLTTDSNQWYSDLVWQYQDPTIMGMSSAVAAVGSRQCPIAGSPGYYYVERLIGFAVVDSTGASHTFYPPNDTAPPQTPLFIVGTGPAGSLCATQTGGTGLLIAQDNSGYTMSIAGGGALTVQDKAGNTWTGTCTYENQCMLNQQMSDSDGNSLTASGNPLNVIDTLGTIAASGVPGYYGTPIMPPGAISYTDTSGNAQSYSFTYTSIKLASNFGCINSSGVAAPQDYGPSDFGGSPTVSMLTGISVPDVPSAGHYTISYEPTPGMSGYYTGRISQITFPSGGSISYAYSGGNNGLNCSYGTVPTLTATVNDNNGHTSIYTYASNLSTAAAASEQVLSGTSFQVTTTDPAGNQTVYNLNGDFQTQVVSYQGSAGGTPLKTVTTCYNGNYTNCVTPSSAITLPITQTDVSTSFGTLNPSLAETLYDSYGNPTSQKSMGYGNVGSSGQCSSATAGICALTTTIYGSWNGSSCTAVSAPPSLPCDVTTTNNNTGVVLAETRVTYSAAGHPTAVSKWVSGSTWFTTNNQYNSNGTLAQTQDPVGNVTQYGYAATGSGGCNSVMLTSTTYPLSSVGSSSQTWNCSGGVLVSNTDVNTQPTTYYYNDPRWRPTGVSYPDGGSSSTTYNTGSSSPWTISTSNLVAGSTMIARLKQYDGLGRVVENELTSDPDGTDYVDTVYDAVGNVHSTSNPHRSGPFSTDGVTTTSYDALARPIEVLEQDGTSTQLWCYNNLQATSAQTNCSAHVGTANTGTWVDYADEVGNHWQRTSNSAGSLTQVIEPNGTSQSPTMETDYTYDGLGNLASTSQCGGSCPSSSPVARYFQYDGVSRLLQSVNPEVGTTSYTYDANGNLLTKVSPAVNASSGTQTIGYCYDKMNRMTYKFYSGTFSCTSPIGYAAAYSYDTSSISGAANTKGILTDEKAYVGTTLVSERSPYLFDQMGRLTAEQQCPYSVSCSTPYTFYYAYNAAGDRISSNNGLSSASYGLAFSFSYDAAERLKLASVTTQPSSWSGTTYPTTLLQANSTSPAAYDPMAHATSVQLGLSQGSTTPAIQMTRQYDSNGRIALETDNNAALYAYAIPNGGYAANGNLLKHTDLATGTWAFTYDTLDRLTAASSTSGIYNGEAGCWNYDSFGNRTVEAFSTATSTPCATGANDNSQYTAASYSASNNRVSGFTYDAAGNVLYDNRNNYLYDSEDRLCSVAFNLGAGTTYEQYLYDAEGRRVGKGTTTSLSCAAPITASQFTLTNQYLLGTGGEQVTELAGTAGAVPQHSTISAGGTLAATYDFINGGLHFMLTDPLGTKRVQVSGTGVAELNCVSLPFGNNLGNTRTTQCSSVGSNTAPDAIETHFTGKERDQESGLDYFGARYYGSNMGRFMSPDEPFIGSDPTDPQSWNPYSYVRNNPLVRVDPDGHDCIYINNDTGAYQGLSRGNCDNSTEALANTGHYVDGTVSTIKENSSGQVTGYSGTSYAGNLMTGSFASPLPYGPLEGPANLAGASLIGNTAGGVVNTIGGAEMTGILMFIDPLLAGTLPEVGLGLGGVGAATGGTHPSTPTGRRGSPMDVPRGTNAPDVINGRQYTGHALDQMQSRGIPSSAVEDAIQNGLKSPGNTSGTTMNQGSGVSVVTNSAGDVVTVIPR